MNNNSEEYQNIIGDWLLSSLSGYLLYVGGVDCNASVGFTSATNGNYGIRPVITIPISYLYN